MTPWKKKYRPAKRTPFKILSKQSHRLYGRGFLAVMEEHKIITRNTFYDKAHRRTLPDKIAAQISKLFQVDSDRWYAGAKSKEPPIPEATSIISEEELNEINKTMKIIKEQNDEIIGDVF